MERGKIDAKSRRGGGALSPERGKRKWLQNSICEGERAWVVFTSHHPEGRRRTWWTVWKTGVPVLPFSGGKGLLARQKEREALTLKTHTPAIEHWRAGGKQIEE